MVPRSCQGYDAGAEPHGDRTMKMKVGGFWRHVAAFGARFDPHQIARESKNHTFSLKIDRKGRKTGSRKAS